MILYITGITISPPSARLIHIKSAKYVKKILEARKIKVILSISEVRMNSDKIMFERITALKPYEKRRVPRPYGYDYL